MFYEEKDINELLLCFNCKAVYEDPHLLPCGETLCLKCINALHDESLKGLLCPFCSNTHLMNQTEFKPNKTILKLMTKKPNEIYRGRAAEKLRNQLNEIQQKAKELTNHINISKDKIKDHCDSIRKEIQIVTEEAHQYLNEHYKLFMDKIDEYEKETQSNVDAEDIYKSEIESKLKEISDFRLKWMDYLEKVVIDDDELVEASKRSDECLCRLEKDLLKLHERTFRGNILTFEKIPIDAKLDIIGKLNIQKKEYLSKNFKDINVLKLNLKDYKEKHALAVVAGKDGNIFVVFQGETKNLHLISLNRQGEVLREQQILLDYNIFYDLKMICNKSALFMYVSFYGSHFNGVNISINYYYLLRRIDFNLNTDKEINIGYNVTSLIACNDKLFCLSNQSFDFNRVYIYDLNLNQIKSVGENNPKLSFYFPSSITQIEASEKNVFLLDDKTITLLNLYNGKILSKFPIVSSQFKCYHQQYVITYDYKNHEIIYYDLDGYIVFKNRVNIQSDVDFRILIDPDNDILLYDPNQLTIYF